MSTKHHDKRGNYWSVSLHDEELALVEERRSKTGLSKAEYGRQALMTATVLSRFNEDDRRALNGLSHMRADINRLVLDCERYGPKNVLNAILKIDDQFVAIYNHLLSKSG